MGFQSKMPPPRGRRGTRSNGAEKSTAVEDFARYSVEVVQDAAAGKEGQEPPPPGRRGTRGSGVRKSTAAEDLAPLLTGMGTRSKGESKPTVAFRWRFQMAT